MAAQSNRRCREGLRVWPRGFQALASAPGCPPFDLMLLALSREFREVDGEAALERVEDLGRALFGIAGMQPTERAQHIAAVLSREVGVRASGEIDDDLHLHCVLATRREHPALLAVVYVEAARRAGVELKLFSGGAGWLVGEVEGEWLVVLDPATGRDPSDPQAVFPLRHHCAHELAFCVLSGLAQRFEAAGRALEAGSALELRLELPIDHRLRRRLSGRLQHRKR